MPDNRRKTDKVQKYTDRISKIAYAAGIAFIIYIVLPLKVDIKEMRTELKKDIQQLQIKQEENMKKIYDFSWQCKDDVNQVRKEYKEDIAKILEKMYAFFKQKS